MLSKNPQKIPFSRRSIRMRFAYKFLRAMKKLNQKRLDNTPHNRRCHMVKMAANASLASAAAGSRRTWSRALLWKIRNNKGRRLSPSLSKRNKTARAFIKERRRRIISSSSSSSSKENPSRSEFGLDGLRRLVPGGEVMDTLSLFDETAHYIKCLTIQVQIMRKLVHVYSG